MCEPDDTSTTQKEIKEKYLDGIASRMSEFKVSGKPIPLEKIIGKDLSMAEKIFGLENFSPRVQAEIVLELAYLRSDAFRERAVRSFGYLNEEDMPDNVRKAFDIMIQEGRSAGSEMKFLVGENGDFNHGPNEVRIPSGYPELSKFDNDTMTVSHEIAHEIYWGSDLYQYKTGNRARETSDGQSFSLGKEESPLMRLDKDKVDIGKFLNNYFDSFIKPNLEDWKKVSFADDDYERNFLSGRLDLLPDYKEQFKESWEHDEMRSERGSEVHEARMLLLREGIWNPFSGEPLKREHLEKLQRRYSKTRIFEYWDTEKSQYFLNNIAQNSNNDFQRHVNDNIRTALADNNIQGKVGKYYDDTGKQIGKDVVINNVALQASTKFDIAYESMEAEQQQYSFGMHA